MHKIALLIPYFGKWPTFMNLFLESCKKNQLIDIIFITDLKPIDNAPKNIKYIQMNFEELKQRIEDKLSLKVPNIKPYKLCDYRPAYGIVFSDELSEYDLWGYGDNDLIYGDLNLFLTDDVLNKHDVFAFRNDHLHGPFTLYKNNDKINSLFKKNEHVNQIFTTKDYLSFDEFGREGYHLDKNLNLTNYSNDNISVIMLKEQVKGEIKLYMESHSKEEIYKTKDIIVYDNGNVYNQKTNEQYAFYHWVLEKRAVWFKYPNWETVPNKYYISETGFYTVSQFKYFKLINFARKTKGGFYWFFLKSFNFLKRRIGLTVELDTYPQFGFVKKI